MAGKHKDISAPIDSLKHKQKRVNIPTNELRDFVAKEMAYRSDPVCAREARSHGGP